MQHRSRIKQDSSHSQPIHSYYQTNTTQSVYVKWILIVMIGFVLIWFLGYYIMFTRRKPMIEPISVVEEPISIVEKPISIVEKPIMVEKPTIVEKPTVIIQRLDKKSPPVYQVKAPIYPLAEKKETYLLIGINTIPRSNNVDYLKQTIHSLMNQMNPTMKIHILVQDNTKTTTTTTSTHSVFEQLKQEYKNATHLITFVSSKEDRLMDPFASIPNWNFLDPNNERPGPLARQQNCDIVSLCSNALEHFSFSHFLFLEDDYLTCQNALTNMLHVLHLLDSFDPSYCTYRVSYGMSGLVMSHEKLKDFILNYVSWNIDLFPIDLLIRQYAFDDPTISCKKVQHHRSYAYETVQWEHIGTISTFEERNKQGFRNPFPRCDAHSATVWNLSNDERFLAQCKTGFEPKVAWNCI